MATKMSKNDTEKKGTRTISIKELTANTYSVKDNSARGVHTAYNSEIKIGDKVIIDNYFTTVTK